MIRHGSPWAAAVALLIVVRGGACADAPPRYDQHSTSNFLIDVIGSLPGDAERFGDAAEILRHNIALTWLGQELPTAKTRCLIHVTIDESRSVGWTRPAESGQGSWISIKASREQAAGTLLAHEIVHAVLACRFGDSMPAWANEGIACRYDDAGRRKILQRALTTMVVEHRWRDLHGVMATSVKTPETYAVAASLTQVLLERHSPQVFIEFVETAGQIGWDEALAAHYGIQGIRDLQMIWQRWVIEAIRTESFSPTIATFTRKSRTSFVAHRPRTSSRL